MQNSSQTVMQMLFCKEGEDMKKIGVALLGLGVVGGGTYEILRDKREMIKRNEGIDLEVKHVLERNLQRCADLGVDPSIVTQNIEDIVNDDEVQIVAEFFGGVEPAKSYLLKALQNGKSVVTANKEMFSKCWHELESAASKSGAGLYFEASCVGGVPVIRTLSESMQANCITMLKGIVNGTTNYILSKMSDDSVDYHTCLEEAQKLGYAEANPTADVEGFDATYKNSILSSLAYHRRVPVEKVYREGISGISVEDIAIGKELGYEIKLLAISKLTDEGKIEARVHLCFLPKDHPLSSVKGSFNALFMHGDSVDDVMLYGRGAGAFPTGSAIVSDIVFAGSQEAHRRYDFMREEVQDEAFASDFSTSYYIRIAVENRDDALAKISAVFVKNGISIRSVLKKTMKNGEECFVFVTAKTKESNMQNTLRQIENLDVVNGVAALIRVEE